MLYAFETIQVETNGQIIHVKTNGQIIHVETHGQINHVETHGRASLRDLFSDTHNIIVFRN